MKKRNYPVEIVEQNPELRLFCEKRRQIIMDNLAEKVLAECRAEEEAIGLFLWKTADLEPPVSQKELMLFHAIYLMHQGNRNTRIESTEKALAILGVPEGKTALTEIELIKEVKRRYWQNFHELTCNLEDF